MTTTNETAMSLEVDETLFRVMLDNLYSNVYYSTLRELVSNAFDAHRVAGIDEAPLLQLPSEEFPELIIRDFGTGLCKDHVNLYLNRLLSSGKREDGEDLTGQYGLGSKAVLVLSSNYKINSYFEGVKYEFEFVRVNRGIPVLRFIQESPTNEPSGLEYIVPFESTNTSAFLGFRSKEIKDFFNLLKSPPRLFTNILDYETEYEFEKSFRYVSSLTDDIHFYEVIQNPEVRYNYSNLNYALRIGTGVYLNPFSSSGSSSFLGTEFFNFSAFSNNLLVVFDDYPKAYELPLSRESIIDTPENKDRVNKLFRSFSNTYDQILFEIMSKHFGSMVNKDTEYLSEVHLEALFKTISEFFHTFNFFSPVKIQSTFPFNQLDRRIFPPVLTTICPKTKRTLQILQLLSYTHNAPLFKRPQKDKLIVGELRISRSKLSDFLRSHPQETLHTKYLSFIGNSFTNSSSDEQLQKDYDIFMEFYSEIFEITEAADYAKRIREYLGAGTQTDTRAAAPSAPPTVGLRLLSTDFVNTDSLDSIYRKSSSVRVKTIDGENVCFTHPSYGLFKEDVQSKVLLLSAGEDPIGFSPTLIQQLVSRGFLVFITSKTKNNFYKEYIESKGHEVFTDLSYDLVSTEEEKTTINNLVRNNLISNYVSKFLLISENSNFYDPETRTYVSRYLNLKQKLNLPDESENPWVTFVNQISTTTFHRFINNFQRPLQNFYSDYLSKIYSDATPLTTEEEQELYTSMVDVLFAEDVLDDLEETYPKLCRPEFLTQVILEGLRNNG